MKVFYNPPYNFFLGLCISLNHLFLFIHKCLLSVSYVLGTTYKAVNAMDAFAIISIYIFLLVVPDLQRHYQLTLSFLPNTHLALFPPYFSAHSSPLL